MNSLTSFEFSSFKNLALTLSNNELLKKKHVFSVALVLKDVTLERGRNDNSELRKNVDFSNYMAWSP